MEESLEYDIPNSPEEYITYTDVGKSFKRMQCFFGHVSGVVFTQFLLLYKDTIGIPVTVYDKYNNKQYTALLSNLESEAKKKTSTISITTVDAEGVVISVPVPDRNYYSVKVDLLILEDFVINTYELPTIYTL